MESWPRRQRITVDDYYRMAEIGVLPPDARVELIEREIIHKAPIGDLADGAYRAHTSIRDPAVTALALLPEVGIDLEKLFER